MRVSIIVVFISMYGILRSKTNTAHKHNYLIIQYFGYREYSNAATAFWAAVITFSKAVELGDTLFIVLMKKPLIFLNW